MAAAKDKYKDFHETINNLRTILYSLGVSPIDNISDDFAKSIQNRASAANKNDNNIKKEI